MADYSTRIATIRFSYRLCTKHPDCRGLARSDGGPLASLTALPILAAIPRSPTTVCAGRVLTGDG
jgi:hypothetical protein